MRKIKKIAKLSLIIGLAGSAALMVSGHYSNPSPKSNEVRETLVIPTKQNDIFREDIRFKLTLPSAFLHQRGETWIPPIRGASFAIDTRNDSATTLAPVEDEAIIVVSLQVVAFDAVDARFNQSNPRYSPILQSLWTTPPKRRFGLNYVSNIQYPGAPPEEVLFDAGPFYQTMIHCLPSGNATPSHCMLTVVGARGGGINSHANAAVMTEVLFRHERLADWKIIDQYVKNFLKDKIVVTGWGN